VSGARRRRRKDGCGVAVRSGAAARALVAATVLHLHTGMSFDLTKTIGKKGRY
jgi:hypothetical protein